MIDRRDFTVLRCYCIESSVAGMRLRVPLGYDVAVGRRYEIRPDLPGQDLPASVGVIGSAWVTVVEVHDRLTDDETSLNVRVVRDAWESDLR
jgi:hypothetical protein